MESAKQQDDRQTIRHLETEVRLLKEGFKQAERIRLLHSKTAQQLKVALAKQREAETARRESEALLQALFDHTFQFIGLMQTDGTLIRANRTALQLVGIREEEVLGKPFWDTPWWTHSPELQNRLRDAVREAAGGATVRFEASHLGSDGDVVHVDFSLKPIRNEQGKIVLLIPEGRDITERKRAEAALRDSEEQYRALFDSSRDALLLLDRQGFFDCNTAAVQLFGAASKTQLIGTPPWDVSPPTQPDGVASLVGAKDRIAKAYEQGTQFFEWRHRRLDGSLFSADVLLSRYERRGKPVLQAAVRDITERMQVEQMLRESEEKFRAVTESAVEGVIVLDNDGKVTYWNRSAEQIFGYPAQAALGRVLNDFLVPARHREAHQEGLKRFGTSGQGLMIGKTVEVEALRSDGREIPIDLSVSAMRLKGRWHAIGVMRDASARKREEIDARRLGEAETMRYLLEGLTHGLKNPLFILTGRLQLLHSKLTQPESADLKADVEKIESAVRRLTEALDHFSRFTAAQQPQPEPCRVAEAVREAAVFLADHLSRGRITLVERLPPDLPPVLADPRQFRQMFLTLMLHAIEAMRENRRGVLTVAATLVADAATRGRGDTENAASPRLPVSASADTGHGDTEPRGQGEGERWIEVRLTHDGEAMTDEKLATLFEPFSALSVSDGGLGLWPVRMTVMMLKGAVTCESRAEHGATFIIRLPAHDR